jgi:hypothetical protein
VRKKSTKTASVFTRIGGVNYSEEKYSKKSKRAGNLKPRRHFYEAPFGLKG